MQEHTGTLLGHSGNTEEYKEIQGNTGEYRGIQGNTLEYWGM